jgi:hypothetical protein
MSFSREGAYACSVDDAGPSLRVSDQKMTAWLAYVDNSVVVGVDADAVNRVRRRCDEALTRAGLLVHEVTMASPKMETLGVEFDGVSSRVRWPFTHTVMAAASDSDFHLKS